MIRNGGGPRFETLLRKSGRAHLKKMQYEIHQKKSRAIIPKVILLLFLSVIFYLGILLNLSLLDLPVEQESITRIATLIFLVLLIIIGIFLSYKHATKPYQFTQDRIIQGKKQCLYKDITNTISKTNLLDKIFKTYSIKLNKTFSLKHLSQEQDLQNYLQQLTNS